MTVIDRLGLCFVSPAFRDRGGQTTTWDITDVRAEERGDRQLYIGPRGILPRRNTCRCCSRFIGHASHVTIASPRGRGSTRLPRMANRCGALMIAAIHLSSSQTVWFSPEVHLLLPQDNSGAPPATRGPGTSGARAVSPVRRRATRLALA